jgi:hypothetical protein
VSRGIFTALRPGDDVSSAVDIGSPGVITVNAANVYRLFGLCTS